jgi:beta-glucosidase
MRSASRTLAAVSCLPLCLLVQLSDPPSSIVPAARAPFVLEDNGPAIYPSRPSAIAASATQLLPQIFPGGVVSAGLSVPPIQVASPNAILSIFGQNVAPAGTLRKVSGGDLVNGLVPSNLIGVCVLFGAQRAPIFLVTPGQLNVQAPQLPASGTVAVQVITGCDTPSQTASNTVNVAVQAVAPEFFYAMYNANGKNPVAATDAITAAGVGDPARLGAGFAPAYPGEILTIYATGLGLTNPSFDPGQLPPAAAQVSGLIVTLDGEALDPTAIQYAGVTPQNAGLYQLNIVVPTLASGDHSIVMTIDGVSSSAGAYLTVASTGAAVRGCGNQAPLAGQPANAPAWMNPNDPSWTNTPYTPANRAQSLVNAMSLSQMEQQMAGVNGAFPEVPGCGSSVRHVLGIPSLCIQTFRISNGPPGVGQGDCATVAKATALPSTLGIASSFDPALAFKAGDIIGAEAKSLAVQVIEGPGMDMLRVPQGGRNFEYLGEDPMLAGTMAAKEIQGDQSHNIIGMCKHFQGNEQEVNRMTVNDILDERTRNEIYFVPFNMCVTDGGAHSVMCAYNLVNGVHECEDASSMTTALRNQWGFQGYVQSDFGATQSTAPSLLAGEDLEMNTPIYFTAANLNSAIGSGAITQANIATALLRRYTVMFQVGDFDLNMSYPKTAYPQGPQISAADQAAHGLTARLIGEQDAVLFRNENNTLPLACGTQSIALIGPSIFAGAAYTGGGGSSSVSPLYTVIPLQGLKNVCPTASINYYNVSDSTSLAAAATAAQAASIAIVMVGDSETEGSDRATIAMAAASSGAPLPDTIVETIVAAQPNTVVVLKNGDPVTLPWASTVPAVLEVWYPGQEDGNIVADLLFGNANPSGKTAATFPMLSTDVPATTPAEYPGVPATVDGYSGPTVYYSEAMQIGYRWYDQQNITPLYPFGFGLSYTTFSVSNVTMTPSSVDGTQPIIVNATVENTGNRYGAEVVQVYLGLPASLGEPPKRLVGFEKVWLNPGQQQVVTITIDPAATNHPFSYWDTATHSWATQSGAYTLYVGNSSRDITFTGSVNVVTQTGGGAWAVR